MSQTDQKAIYDKLAFTCTYEIDRLPQLTPNADSLFKYGRYLQTKKGPKDYETAGRYYRIAAAHGHYKANNNLQLLLSGGYILSPNRPVETIGLVDQLIAQGIPSGYYDMGRYLMAGYGAEQSKEKAMVYFRKAADLGNPEAQYHIGELLGRIWGPKDIMVQIQQCAADQGHGESARSVAGFSKVNKNHPEAIKYYQKGVELGHSQSVFFMEKTFSKTESVGELYYVGLNIDVERSRRYELIGQFIDRNEGLNPKVPDIDQIVPLPPAKLPEWDGTFQWQKDRDAAGIPPQPSEELILRLCEEKGLNPITGLPLVKS